MDNAQYDYLIIGSGAGGSAAAYQLAQTGKRVLLLEKGPPLPKDGSTLNVDLVIRQGVFKSREPWLDKDGAPFVPEEYFNLGGKTKWYGAALLRFAPHEFEADPAHQCLAWPVRYQDLEPYYNDADRLLGVHTVEPEPDLERIVARIRRHAADWQLHPLGLALAPEITSYPEEAAHFDAFASVKGLKFDAERAFLEPVRLRPNLSIVTGQAVRRLLGAEGTPQRVRGVETKTGEVFEADRVLLAAGALHSPRLLQDYLEGTGLAAELPAYRMVGRYYKQHLLTALLAFGPTRQTDLLRKTALLLNQRVPHSSIQPLGFDAELIAALMPGFVPQPVARMAGQYAYGFFLQTEDGSTEENRVLAGKDARPPQLDYDPKRLMPAVLEHRRLVRSFQRALFRAGFVGLAKPVPLAGTAHACGSLVAGNDPRRSVVDAAGRVHGLENLYVVDGSVLPRSSRVNPSLTIYAWALRVTHLLARRWETAGLQSSVA